MANTSNKFDLGMSWEYRSKVYARALGELSMITGPIVIMEQSMEDDGSRPHQKFLKDIKQHWDFARLITPRKPGLAIHAGIISDLTSVADIAVYKLKNCHNEAIRDGTQYNTATLKKELLYTKISQVFKKAAETLHHKHSSHEAHRSASQCNPFYVGVADPLYSDGISVSPIFMTVFPSFEREEVKAPTISTEDRKELRIALKVLAKIRKGEIDPLGNFRVVSTLPQMRLLLTLVPNCENTRLLAAKLTGRDPRDYRAV